MNKKFTKLIAALALLVCMTPSMVGWGQTRSVVLTLDCATPAPTGTTSTAFSSTSDVATFLNSAAGLSNQITCSAKTGDVYKGKGSGGGSIPQQCLKVGKASGGGGFTFTIPETYDEIGEVEMTCYGWKTTSSISLNEGTAQTFTTAQVVTTKTFELASATRTITISVTTSAVCITEIVLKSAVTGEATTVTIDASDITNTDVASGTAAGSLSATVKDESSNTISAAVVTWSSSKPSVATINTTTGAVTLIKKGSTTITASYAGVEGTYQPSSNTYVLNVTNSDANDGTSDHPFTVTEARDALDEEEINPETDYYVRGIIAKKNSISSGNLTYWLSDDGSMTTNLQCYNGKYIDGDDFTEETDLEVGDFATVKGKLSIYSGSTYQFNAGNQVVSITPRTKVNIATFTATTNPLILGETPTTTTTVTNNQLGWTPVSYSYESSNVAVATVNESGVVTAVAKGTANITVTPVMSPTDPTYKVGDSKSIEITVNKPSHTASFSVNGAIDPGNNVVVEEDYSITFPADPAAIGSKSFVGWVEDPIVGTTDETPTFVTSATMSTSNVTYYAVFATSATGTVTKTDTLTLSTTGVSGNSYSSWTNKQATNTSHSAAVYSGCNAGGNSSIQLNATSGTSYRGIISTTSGGKLKKVTIKWNSNTSKDRSVTVYGKNKAYTTMAAFSGSNGDKGTSLGTITKGTSTELTITCDSTYVGFYATQAIYMDTISIDWETTGTVYSSYCTTIVLASKEITGYGSSTGGWYLIAPPSTVNPTAVTGMIDATPANYDLYYFDQSEANGKWRNYKKNHFDLEPGKGYLYANVNDVTLEFTGIPYTGSTCVVALTYPDDPTGLQFPGLNLIGNPFATAATLNKAFYRMNGDGNGFVSALENTSVSAMEGVFVQATGTGQSATFTVPGGAKAGGPKSIPSLNVIVSRERGSVIDNAIFRFDDGETLGKFMFNEEGTKLCVPVSGKEYAIVNAQAEGEMPVNFKAAENGSYTLSFSIENAEMDYMHLIDNMTGADVDLLANPSYTFDARTSDYASRFRLVFSANDENGASTGSATFAYFNGSEWVVNSNGNATLQVVDVMGRVLSSETVNGNHTMNLNLSTGVYMLRLVNGNDVKTQKIVVR